MTDPRSWPGEVRVFADYDRDVREEADVVVVGSGPCGSVAAYELAAAGRRVVLIEEGPPFTPGDFALDGSLSMARTMREGGLRFTMGGYVMPTMQAIALGGGSLVNSAICNRTPEFRLQEWCTDHDLARTARADLDPHYDAIEEFLGIAPTPDEVQGPRNLLFRDGCKTLGWSSEPCPRNVIACRGSGECFTGCRARAKQSMDISYVPAAMRHGARVLTSVRVEGLLADGRRLTGLSGRVVEPFTGKASHAVRIDAKAVVLAAGVLATPILLQRSDLANGSGELGRNLMFHPGTSVLGVFPDEVDPVFGATQGYQSLEFLRDGFKLETLWSPPGVLAVRMPGFGHDFQRELLDMRHAAVFDAIASCQRSRGTVKERGRSGQPKMSWHFHPDDARILGTAVWRMAELFFAAGAAKIVPGVHGAPDVMHSLAEAEVLRDRPPGAGQMVCASTHVFGTARMHGDPRRGVVDEDCKAHDLDNLYVADTSVFPLCPGVNPMLTGMALARRAGLALADRL